jgi:hypothetical protein
VNVGRRTRQHLEYVVDIAVDDRNIDTVEAILTLFGIYHLVEEEAPWNFAMTNGRYSRARSNWPITVLGIRRSPGPRKRPKFEPRDNSGALMQEILLH